MTPASTATPARFSDWIANRQQQEPARRKGERTRDRIRLATVELLNEVGYRDMKVADVCARAGITPPVLYLYFENKQALTADVLQEFLDDFLTRGDHGEERSAYAAILDANRHWITLARANAGLMRCLLQLSEEVPEFARLFARASDLWYRRIAHSVVRRFPSAASDETTIHLIAHAMGGMIDELTRKLFAEPDPHVRKLASSVARTDEQLAHFVSVLWYRALYARDPGPESDAAALTPRLTTAIARSRRSP